MRVPLGQILGPAASSSDGSSQRARPRDSAWPVTASTLLILAPPGWDLRSEAPVVRDDQPECECGGWGQRRPGNRICKRGCKPDRTGRGEMGETRKIAGDLLPQVR